MIAIWFIEVLTMQVWASTSLNCVLDILSCLWLFLSQLFLLLLELELLVNYLLNKIVLVITIMVTNLPTLYLQFKDVITYFAVIIFHFIFILKHREFPIFFFFLFKNRISGLSLQFLTIPTVNLYVGLQFGDRSILFSWIKGMGF